MRNDYKAENVVEFMENFVKHEEHFDNVFFERLSCMFTTLALMCEIDVYTYGCDNLIQTMWRDIERLCDKSFTIEDYDCFHNMMIKWIV